MPDRKKRRGSNVMVVFTNNYHSHGYCVCVCVCGATGHFAVTDMNDHSSRSHVIFTVTVERSDLGPDNQLHVRMGKLNLVDLAVRHAFIVSVIERFICILCPVHRGQRDRVRPEQWKRD